MSAPELAIVGRLRKAHGVRGEVVVEVITDTPDAIFAPGGRVLAGTADGEPTRDRIELHIESARPFKDGLLVRFQEIGDRDTADSWRERYLLVPVDELQPPGEGEVFYHELLGMQVRTADGATLGPVTELYELPQGLTLEVRRSNGTVLIPYREGWVVSTDRGSREIVIDPPDGLLD
jgi:16S rRNA processing protein RimM